MDQSKQKAKAPLTMVPPGATITRQLSQARLRAIVHVADGHQTAAELAARTGVSQAHMSNVLTGRRNMSPALADRLNEAIDSHERAHAHPFGGKAA